MRDYLRLAFRRKWAFMVPTVVGVLLALGVAVGVHYEIPPVPMLLPTKYRAEALVRRKDLGLLHSAPSSIIARQSPVLSLDVLRQEILTWNNLQRVIRQTGLDVHLETPGQWQGMYQSLRERISIRAAAQSRGVDLVEIAVIHTDPARAAKIANAIADNYVEESKKTIRTDSTAVVSFLEAERDKYLEKMHEAEEKLEDYREEHYADLPEVKEGILNQLLSLRTDKGSRVLLLEEARNRLAEVDKQLVGVPRTVTAEVERAANPRYAELEAQLAQSKRELLSHRMKYTDEHPAVKQLQNEITELEQQLEETPEQVPGTERETLNPLYGELYTERLNLEREIKAQEAALLKVESQIQAAREELERMAGDEKRYTQLRNEIEENSEIYSTFRRSLVAARTRLEADAGKYGTQVEMVSRALKPAIPYWMAYNELMLALVFGGGMAGVGLMFSLEYLDRSFRNLEDASSFLEMPVLGSVALIVTPEQVARRQRRRKLAAAGLALCILGAAGVGIYLMRDAVAEFMRTSVAPFVRQIVG
jgi:polysaccharide chain length determinant protein (PEP-CTERM system associated)